MKEFLQAHKTAIIKSVVIVSMIVVGAVVAGTIYNQLHADEVEGELAGGEDLVNSVVEE